MHLQDGRERAASGRLIEPRQARFVVAMVDDVLDDEFVRRAGLRPRRRRQHGRAKNCSAGLQQFAPLQRHASLPRFSLL